MPALTQCLHSHSACTLLTVVCKLCVVQVSPSSAKKLAECLTVSELTELCDTVPDPLFGFPTNEEDLSIELERYYSANK